MSESSPSQDLNLCAALNKIFFFFFLNTSSVLSQFLFFGVDFSVNNYLPLCFKSPKPGIFYIITVK